MDLQRNKGLTKELTTYKERTEARARSVVQKKRRRVFSFEFSQVFGLLDGVAVDPLEYVTHRTELSFTCLTVRLFNGVPGVPRVSNTFRKESTFPKCSNGSFRRVVRPDRRFRTERRRRSANANGSVKFSACPF